MASISTFFDELSITLENFDYEISFNPLYFTIAFSEEIWEQESFYVRFHSDGEIYLDVREMEKLVQSEDSPRDAISLSEWENGISFEIITIIHCLMGLMKEYRTELTDLINTTSKR